jgi:hypothetical protein
MAQVPLTEAGPPKFYGGTDRVISWLTEELVDLGHVCERGFGDQGAAGAHVVKGTPARWFGRDPSALHVRMVEYVCRHERLRLGAIFAESECDSKSDLRLDAWPSNIWEHTRN